MCSIVGQCQFDVWCTKCDLTYIGGYKLVRWFRVLPLNIVQARGNVMCRVKHKGNAIMNLNISTLPCGSIQ
jgi:hypothetical protein